MHKMHAAKQHPCRFEGECDRKLPGNWFARSYNRSDHEKRVHRMKPSNTRTKSLSKGSGSGSSGLRSPDGRPNVSRMPSNYTSLSSSEASPSSTASSPIATRSSNPIGSQSLATAIDLTGPISIGHYGSEHLITPANLHLAGSYDAVSYDSLSSASSAAPAMDRRSSAGPIGVEKRRRRRAPSSSSVDEYSRIVEAFQECAASLSATPDPSELSRLQSYVDQIKSLQERMGI